MLGFSGSFRGKPVSVMGSGMGMPSIGIYSYELFTEYEVASIVRVGSTGGYRADLKLFDIVLATEAYSESSFAKCQSGFSGDRIPADGDLCQKLRASAACLGLPLIEGSVHSSDVFYYGPPSPQEEEPWRKVARERGCLCVEMESFALFHNARVTGGKAACLLTVSDLLFREEATDAAAREKGFTKMMEIALGVL
jgi:purine-nucleoside phosphorylase